MHKDFLNNKALNTIELLHAYKSKTAEELETY